MRRQDNLPAVIELGRLLAVEMPEAVFPAWDRSIIADFHKLTAAGEHGIYMREKAARSLVSALRCARDDHSEALLDAILACPEKPDPRYERDLINRTITQMSDYALPKLHAIGFHFQNNPVSRAALATAMGKGRWPSPDLLCPDILSTKEAVEISKAWWNTSVGQEGLHLRKIAQLDRMDTLPHNGEMREHMCQMLALATPAHLSAHIASYQKPEHFITVIVHMLDKGWLDANRTREISATEGVDKERIDQIMSLAEQHWLENTIPASPKTSAPGMRL